MLKFNAALVVALFIGVAVALPPAPEPVVVGLTPEAAVQFKEHVAEDKYVSPESLTQEDWDRLIKAYNDNRG